jgi:uncharacterized protein with GYD domain
METYIILGRFTQQGAETIREFPDRVNLWKQPSPQFGVQIKGLFLVMGQYDFVVIMEAPDDETIAQAMLSINLQGNYRTETLRAFSENELQGLIASLP